MLYRLCISLEKQNIPLSNCFFVLTANHCFVAGRQAGRQASRTAQHKTAVVKGRVKFPAPSNFPFIYRQQLSPILVPVNVNMLD
jgi:hypothetical protein